MYFRSKEYRGRVPLSYDESGDKNLTDCCPLNNFENR